MNPRCSQCWKFRTASSITQILLVFTLDDFFLRYPSSSSSMMSVFHCPMPSDRRIEVYPVCPTIQHDYRAQSRSLSHRLVVVAAEVARGKCLPLSFSSPVSEVHWKKFMLMVLRVCA